MESKKVLRLLFLAFLLAFFLTSLLPFETLGESDLPVHNVETGLDYATIQEAINNPNTLDGHTIQVDAGRYREHVVVNKSVKLVGENKFDTFVDGEGAGTVFYVATANVEIAGFTVENSSSLLGGICVYHSDGVNINNNVIRNNYYGIYLNYSGNDAISGNNISNNYSGLYIESSSNNVFSGNNISNIWAGIHFESSGNNVLSGNNLSDNQYGVYFESSGNNVLSNNVALNNRYGIWLNASSNNILLDNVVSNSDNGFRTVSSTNNTLLANTALNNYLGAFLESSSNNTVLHNNFINNTIQVRVTAGFTDIWDMSYPSGGNYWSDYDGTDLYLGSHQNVTGVDGIGDKPYVINANNTDHYPLMAIARDFIVTLEEETHHVSTICNSTISGFQFNESYRMISFNVTGADGTLGFCRVGIPHILIDAPYIILIDGEEANVTAPTFSNGTHAFLYFTYVLSTREVAVASKPFYELLQKYNDLLEEYQKLNSTLYGLLDQYAQLFVNHARLKEDYDAMNATYHQLQDDYDDLNASYYVVLGDYNSLRIVFNTLVGQYNSLNSTYNSLLDSVSELQSKYDAAANELAGIRNVMYAFLATTLIGVFVLLPFSVKYYRMSNRQKEIIQAYSPLEIARVLFNEDVERRGGKIEKFEEKYGVRIRPSSTLEDAIKSLKLKERKG